MPEARVLLVDDDADLRADLAALLGRPGSGLTVVGSAGSAAEAEAWLAGHTADVALVDLGLGAVSGVDLIRAARPHAPGMAWVAFTVFDDGPTVVSAIEAGAAGYLLKSTTPSRLVEALHEALEGGSPLTAQIARHVLDRLREPLEPCVEDLSPRELEVLTFLAKGVSYGEAARLLGIGLGTVQTHVKSIYKKLGVSSKAEAAVVAVRSGVA